jgi:hypothetical protein
MDIYRDFDIEVDNKPAETTDYESMYEAYARSGELVTDTVG